MIHLLIILVHGNGWYHGAAPASVMVQFPTLEICEQAKNRMIKQFSDEVLVVKGTCVPLTATPEPPAQRGN